MSEPDFPEGFQGAGPTFAAVPLGDACYALAARGVTTYIPESASARVQSAFLDRGQAEAIADASTHGELSRYEGLCGWNDLTTARAPRRAPGASRAGGRPMTGDGLRLQPGVTPEMHDRLVEANADAKQHAAELERFSRISWPSPLSPEQAAAIRAQAFAAKPAG
jgi:hypothetical protein